MREGWGTPYPSRCAYTSSRETCDSTLRRRGLFARPSTRVRRSARARHIGTREGEGLHVRVGHGEIRYVLRVVRNVRMTDYLFRTTRCRALHANVPAFKIPETDIFDKKDPSPSSLPTSLPSTPTSQLSMMLNDASRCDPRDVANTRSRVPSTGE